MAEKESQSHDETAAQVERIVHSIPRGKVMSYGMIGARCNPPISGYICGRIMNGIRGEAPWWRVVSKDGKLPIAKRNPAYSLQQRKKLESEGVKFDDEGKVRMDLCSAESLFS